MADITISQLAAAAGTTDDTLIEVSQLSETVTVTATDISADNADGSFNRVSGSWITDGFAVGKRIKVAGFTESGNNVTSAAVTAVTATKLTTDATLTTEAAGDTVTVSQWETKSRPLATLEDSTAQRVRGVPVDVTSEISGGALDFDYAANGDNQYATLSSAGTALTVSNIPAGASIQITLFAAATYAPDISAFTPWLRNETPAFSAVNVILAEALTNTTVRYIDGGEYAS